MKTVEIQASHLAAVARIEAECFGEPWSESALELLLGENAVGFVCECDGETVAYGGMIYSPFDGQVTNIAVKETHRRYGCGRAILQALIAHARARGVEEISLEVRASNAAAIALYSSQGFSEAGRRRGFYSHPTEDALVMLLPL